MVKMKTAWMSLLAWCQNLKTNLMSCYKASDNKEGTPSKDQVTIFEKIRQARKIRRARKPIKNWFYRVVTVKNKTRLVGPDGKDQGTITLPEWVDYDTANKNRLHTVDNVPRSRTLLYVSCGLDKAEYGRKMVLATFHEPYSLTDLPDLPERVHLPGIFRTGKHIYIVGGWRVDAKGDLGISTRVDRLCLQTNEWESCAPLKRGVTRPETVMHKQFLYVIGSQLEDGLSKYVQRYDMETMEWSKIKELPYGVSCKTAKAIVCNEIITVVTRNRVMRYQPRTDKWTMKKFNEMQYVPVLWDHEGQLCANIRRFTSGKNIYDQMVYDEEENEWFEKE